MWTSDMYSHKCTTTQHFLLYSQCFANAFVLNVAKTQNGVVKGWRNNRWTGPKYICDIYYTLIQQPSTFSFCQDVFPKPSFSTSPKLVIVPQRVTGTGPIKNIWHLPHTCTTQHFLLFPECFQNLLFRWHQNSGLWSKALKGQYMDWSNINIWHLLLHIQKQYFLLSQCFQRPSFTMSSYLEIEQNHSIFSFSHNVFKILP